MNYSILTIEKATADLERTREFYQSATFKEKEEELLRLIYEKKGFKPFSSMKIIRKVSFFIKHSISLWQLQRLAEKIEEIFGIYCFQISIDREKSIANMLFGWIDKATGECIVLTDTGRKWITVTILDFLDLPRPQCTDTLLRYFLLNKYNKNDAIFGQQLEFLERKEYDKLSYPILRDCLKYAEMVCKKLLK